VDGADVYPGEASGLLLLAPDGLSLRVVPRPVPVL
jgi:hypothetical protein